MASSIGPKVALVHDWLTSFGGAERCLIQLHELFPTAPIYTLVHDAKLTPPELRDAHIITSHLQKLPGATTDYQRLLPLMPFAVEQFDLRGFDLVISSSHAVAKGVLTGARQKHLSYCYTPMRYVWDLYQTYLEHTQLSGLAARTFKHSAHYLRMWDYASSQRVDKFLAISDTVRERIRHSWGRDAPVVYPPVDCDFFVPDPAGVADYFLIVSRFVPYKRIDLAIDVFNERSDRLLIVGNGPQLKRLKRCARRNIEFIGSVSDAELRALYQNCRALVFPAEEDFGLTPVEAMACGRPVVALGYGGAAETVVDFGRAGATPANGIATGEGARAGVADRSVGPTGVLFPEQTPLALDEALDRCLHSSFAPEACRARALQFDQRIFRAKIKAAAEYLLAN